MATIKDIGKVGNTLITHVKTSELDAVQLACLAAQKLNPGFYSILVTHDGKAEADDVLQCSFLGIKEFFGELLEGEDLKGQLAVFLDNQPTYFDGHAFHPVSAKIIGQAVNEVIAAGGDAVSRIYIVD